MKTSHLLLLTCVVTLAAMILHGCNTESQPPRVIVGPVTAYYEIQTSASSSVGTGPSGEEFAEICFFENYIMLRKDQDKGTVFPLHRVKSFRWKKKAK